MLLVCSLHQLPRPPQFLPVPLVQDHFPTPSWSKKGTELAEKRKEGSSGYKTD